MNNTFSLEIAKNLVDSSEQFPVDFDLAWQWLEYSTKQKGQQSFDNCGMAETIDFTVFNQKVKDESKFGGYRTDKKILMTVDAFKCWAMMSKTETGKVVRQYFLECEKIAKEKQSIKPKTALELAREQVKLLEQIELLEQEKHLLEEENHVLSEVVDELFDYSSIIRVAKFNNCSEKNFNWRRLKAISLTLALEIKRVPCPRFGEKLLYSHEAWRYVYPNYRLPETTTLVINTTKGG